MNAQLRNAAPFGAVRMPEPLGWGWSKAASPAPAPSARAGRLLRAALLGVAVSSMTAVLALAIGFFVFVESLERLERRPAERADGIVALTGGAQRIGDAIDLLAQGYARRLLISGVNERTSREEIARLNPGQRRLVECCVDLDYRARNTIGNAIETRRWTERNGFRSLIVVTSAYHMPRTLDELDHAMPNLRKIPHSVVTPNLDPAAWWHDPATARILASEYVKFLVMRVRRLLEADPETSATTALFGGEPIKISAEDSSE
jgi:uncharacterized SAM-binding protein YcdF (DUF218 family)